MSAPAEQTGGTGWRGTLGNSVGLIAGAVAVVYLLGGVIFSIRLLLDSVSISETASVVGQLSRELLITTGLVQGIGPAVVVGLAAGVFYGAVKRPRHPSEWQDGWPARLGIWPNLRTTSWPLLPPHAWLPLIAATPVLAITLAAAPQLGSVENDVLIVAGVVLVWALLANLYRKDRLKAITSVERGISTWIALLPLASALALPSAILLLGEGAQSWQEVAVVAATVAINWATAVVGWYVLRNIPVDVTQPDADPPNRAQRGLLAGLMWAGIALPGALMFASFLPFEKAEVCLRSGQRSDSVQGWLVAENGTFGDPARPVSERAPERREPSGGSGPSSRLRTSRSPR